MSDVKQNEYVWYYPILEFLLQGFQFCLGSVCKKKSESSVFATKRRGKKEKLWNSAK